LRRTLVRLDYILGFYEAKNKALLNGCANTAELTGVAKLLFIHSQIQKLAVMQNDDTQIL